MIDDPRVADSFWKKTTPQGEDECWPWSGMRLPRGYGMIGLRFDGKRKSLYAHRVSYELHHGPIPAGYVVMHSCDNPSCVNPAHLSAGTQRENMQDAKRKGRTRGGVRGERVGSAKLTEADVREIRRLRAEGLSLSTVAARYATTKTNISYITRRRSWAHVE